MQVVWEETLAGQRLPLDLGIVFSLFASLAQSWVSLVVVHQAGPCRRFQYFLVKGAARDELPCALGEGRVHLPPPNRPQDRVLTHHLLGPRPLRHDLMPSSGYAFQVAASRENRHNPSQSAPTWPPRS